MEVRKALWVASIISVLVVISSASASAILIEQKTLEINWTDYQGIKVQYYCYENGTWVQKEKPLVWWEYVKLNDRQIHFPNAQVSYSVLAGTVVKVGRMKNLPTYGGSFIDPKRGILFVYIADEEDANKILENLENTNVKLVLLKGEYSFKQLLKWKDELTHELKHDKLLSDPWVSIVASNTLNKVVMGFDHVNESIIKEIENLLKRKKIPLQAIEIEIEGKPELDISRSDKFRPVIGGIQIDNPNIGSTGDCTLGFVALRNGEKGFVTAGHCGGKRHPFYQPVFTGNYMENYIGYVEFDKGGPRYSDTIWVRLDTSGNFEIYNEANPTSHYVVFGEMQSQSAGMYVCKGGKATGETCGTIVQVNVTVDDHPKYGTLYGQVKATYSRAGGDSGGPVYYYTLDGWIQNWCHSTYGRPCVDVYGIHWGGKGGYAYYSPISSIEVDLGNLDTNG